VYLSITYQRVSRSRTGRASSFGRFLHAFGSFLICPFGTSIYRKIRIFFRFQFWFRRFDCQRQNTVNSASSEKSSDPPTSERSHGQFVRRPASLSFGTEDVQTCCLYQSPSPDACFRSVVLETPLYATHIVSISATEICTDPVQTSLFLALSVVDSPVSAHAHPPPTDSTFHGNQVTHARVDTGNGVIPEQSLSPATGNTSQDRVHGVSTPKMDHRAFGRLTSANDENFSCY